MTEYMHQTLAMVVRELKREGAALKSKVEASQASNAPGSTLKA